jgi:hypothetical protein
MQGDDNEKGRAKGDKHVSELQEVITVGSEDELFWTKQLRI